MSIFQARWIGSIALALSLQTGGAAAGLATSPNTTTDAPPPSGGIQAISTAGDFDGDGLSDLAIAYGTRVEVHLGSPAGVHAAPDWKVTGLQGATVSTAGDVNGDSIDDLIVGDWRFMPVLPSPVYVYFGSANLGSRPDGTPSNADWSAISPEIGTRLGVSGAGDLDGDGYGDIAVSEYGAVVGWVYVWLGGPMFGSTGPVGFETADWWAAGDENDHFGRGLASAGDVNGDGFGDLVIGVPEHKDGAANVVGAAAVYFGQASFAARADGTVANADRLIEGVYAGASTAPIGQSVAGVGDMTGDGYADVGVSGVASFEVYSGASVGALLQLWSVPTTPNAAALAYENPIATAGDVNGDGLADVVVGSRPDSNAYVYYGRLNAQPSPTPDETRPVNVALGGIHLWVATAGDVNGDGFSDVAISSTSAFQVAVYHGSGDPTSLSGGFSPENGLHWLQADGGYGLGLSAAGDVNGDGYSDFVVGQPGWDGGEAEEGRFEPVYGGSCGPSCGPQIPVSPADLWESNQPGAAQGWSVAGAGDVNGDGYDDVVVGAPQYDVGADADAGRIELYLGGAAGLATMPSYTFEDPNGAGAQLGLWVAGAGDVNGDGLGDVLVSAPYADVGGLADAGIAYLFLGASTPIGVDKTPAWTMAGTLANEHFGIRAASAGDVDRDGRSDVVIAGLGLGLGGQVAALVYRGQSGGLSSSPSTFVGDSAGDDNGITVASAGDVNGDGYADVILGEPEWTGSRGRIQILYGSSAGTTATGATTIAGPNAGARFGSGVGGGGDVNGDGYGDVAVGEQWRTHTEFADGAAYVFLGGTGGLATAAAVELPGTPGDSSDYGRDVALNLDVNGDGFADVIVGAIGADNGPAANGGQVFGYYGNGQGQPRRTRARTLGAGPLTLLDAIPVGDAPTFGVASLVHSAGGRTRGRLEVEVKPLAQAFDGTGVVTSADNFLDLSGSDFSLKVGCATMPGCRWRARQRARNPYFPTTPWISPPGNTATELDLRLGGPDSDGDLVPDAFDVCPSVPDPGQANQDGDLSGDACDNCATVANDDQADGDADLAGNVCDNCTTRSNPRVAADFLTTSPWATLTGGQRDDDHDGYGNQCDAKFPGVGGALVGAGDLEQFRRSSGKSRTIDICGTTGTKPCAIFDLDEAATLIGADDLTRYRQLNGKVPGPKCTACPLPCKAGTAGSCGAIP